MPEIVLCCLGFLARAYSDVSTGKGFCLGLYLREVISLE